MNMWGFGPEVFELFGAGFREFLTIRGDDLKAEFYIPSGVDKAISAGEAVCEVLPTPAQWFGVTYMEDKSRVQEAVSGIVASGEYPSPLWG